MADKIFTEIFAIATAIVGVAVIAVLVRQNSKTPDVIKGAGDTLATFLKKAVSPVT